MAMSSQEFKFDIFISYRHNDNKAPGGTAGEGWVTEFVNHLTTELETMVKGSVSIYFDKNPHTGLQETHQVEDSLSSKLKASIFVPILSQTYCDPDCYAWKQEFLPFLRLIAEDTLGPSIKLHSGNVASRVLPVCIHDLEPADLDLVETQLDGKLRAIPFVFKSPGVNRPLRAREEDPLKNTNHTQYRDQINKIANAVKEIINSIRTPDQRAGHEVKAPLRKNALLDGLLKSPSTIKSIAVMPLVFKSTDPEEEFLSHGFAEDLFTSLKQIKALRLSILGLTSAVNGSATAGKQSSAGAATLILTGSMTVQDNAIGVQVRLMQTATDTLVWQGEYQCERNKLFSLRPTIILQICESLSISLKETERQGIQHLTGTGTGAIELYWKGRYHWRRRGNDLLTSLECFQKAADLDPEFALAHAGIANAAVLLGYYEMIPLQESITQSRDAAMRALSIDPTLIDAYYALAYVALCYEWAWPDAEHNFNKVFEINAGSATAMKKFKLCLTQIACNFEEAEDEPVGAVPHFLQAYALMHKGKFEEGLKVAQIATRKDSGSFMALRAVGLCYLGLGYEKEAVEALTVAAQLSNRHPWALFDLIGAYATMAHNEGAQNIMEEAMAQVNALPARINDFFFQPT